jgi:hypothetical protein
MAADFTKARDLQLLDAVDALVREPFEGSVWRVTREGRLPTFGSPSKSRWCTGQFDVLYTSLKKDGAIAEINAFLMLQPVFPSKMQWYCHELRVRSTKTLRLADLPTLERLGVDTAHYNARNYDQTQGIADAAFFLGFDGLIAPSARWASNNLVLFTDRIPPQNIEQVGDAGDAIDWAAWRRSAR